MLNTISKRSYTALLQVASVWAAIFMYGILWPGRRKAPHPRAPWCHGINLEFLHLNHGCRRITSYTHLLTQSQTLDCRMGHAWSPFSLNAQGFAKRHGPETTPCQLHHHHQYQTNTSVSQAIVCCNTHKMWAWNTKISVCNWAKLCQLMCEAHTKVELYHGPVWHPYTQIELQRAILWMRRWDQAHFKALWKLHNLMYSAF